MKNYRKFPLNIQLFAEEAQEEGAPDDKKKTSTEEEKNEEKGLSQEKVDEIIKKRLARERKKWEKEQTKAKTEAEKLENMTDEEKKEYQMGQRLKDLEDREKNITKRELTAVAKEQLSSNGVPAELSAYVDYTDAESVKESVKQLTKTFNDAVQKNVEEKIKGGKTLDKAKNANLSEEEQIRELFKKSLK